MKYTQYTSSRMFSSTKGGVIKLPIQQEIFDSYGSGANQKSKSLILKFLIITILFFIAMFIVFYLYASSLQVDPKNEDEVSSISSTPKVEKSSINNSVSTPIPINTNINNKEDVNSYFMELLCNLEYKLCYFNDKIIDLNFYYQMNELYKFEEVSTVKLTNTNFIKFSVFVNRKFYTIYKPLKDNYENDKYNNINVFSTNK